MLQYDILGDIDIAGELLGLDEGQIAKEIGVSTFEISRWRSGLHAVSKDSLERFYDFAYRKKVELNRIKTQIYRDRYENAKRRLLFHGSKEGLGGAVSHTKARQNNDFGGGFYLGEAFMQAAMFVANFPSSSVYCSLLDTRGLKIAHFGVGTDWMLAISYFRGRLRDYAEHPKLKAVLRRADEADVVIAPIADNRMYELIDAFSDGELTDVQCGACLSVTDLGAQYVLKSERAIKRLKMLERVYLCKEERAHYLRQREDENRISRDKVKLARREYRGQGKYVEELFV